MSPSAPTRTKMIKDLFIPSGLIIILYLVVSLTLLALLNLRGLWNISVGATVGPVASQDISPITSVIDKLQDKIDGPVIFLFWILIGCIAYGATLIIQNVFMVAGREVKKSRYIKGDEMPQRGYWRCVLADDLFFFAVAVMLAAYLVIYLGLLLPAFAYQFYTGIYHHFNYEGLLACFTGVLLNALAMYLIAVLLRIMRCRWHTICPDI